MNPSLYHKFLDISIILAELNPIEANKPLGTWKLLLISLQSVWFLVVFGGQLLFGVDGTH
jgi:hypothetical protein